MKVKIYPWKRYWLPVDRPLYLKDGVYLYDPASAFGAVINPDVRLLRDLEALHFVALLGEPGMGKSTTLEMEVQAHRMRLETAGARVLHFRLRECGSGAEIEELLSREQSWRDWREGKHPLYLFLDDLDEARLVIPRVTPVLLRALRSGPLHCLFVRIACRTAEWPQLLQRGLTAEWPADKVGIYDLCPLRIEDVGIAVRDEGLDPERFLEQVEERGAGPLAAKPQTLHSLLLQFASDGCLPPDQIQLYEKACWDLSREDSDSRHDLQITGRLGDEQRLEVAAAIAAITVFTGRNVIWVGRGSPPAAVLITAAELAALAAEDSAVTQEAVEEVLGTALFSGAGEFRLSWSHRSYGEYLAARYAVKRKLPLAQILSLVTNGNDPERRVAPPLQQTAAWLAAAIPEVHEYLLGREPEVLLASDVVAGDWVRRRALVRTLFERMEGEALPISAVRDFDRLKKLKHPEMSDQLRPYIIDATKPYWIRRAAVRVAQACAERGLQSDLRDIALNPTEDVNIRIEAADAVATFGDQDTRSQLRPLAFGDIAPDDGDELKGHALAALWPGQVTLDEVLQLWTPPRNALHYGAYRHFLRRGFVEKLPPKQLPEAMARIAREYGDAAGRDDHEAMPEYLDEVAEGLILKALEQPDAPDVVQECARLVAVRLNRGRFAHRRVRGMSFHDDPDVEPTNRRHLLVALAPLMLELGIPPERLRSARPRLLAPMDLPWLLEQVRGTEDAVSKRLWIDWIPLVLSLEDPDARSVVLAAAAEDNALAEAFEWMAPAAARDAHTSDRESRDGHCDVSSSEATGGPGIVQLGEDAWLELLQSAGFEPLYLAAGEELDYTRTPGWQKADEPVRMRILAAARRYVEVGSPSTDAWIEDGPVSDVARAGHAAFLLLRAEAPEQLDRLGTEVLSRWAGAILASTVDSGGEGWRERHPLNCRMYQEAPESWLEALRTLVRAEDRHGIEPRALLHAEICWDRRIGNALLDLARREDLRPRTLTAVLQLLLAKDVEEAAVYAASLIPSPPPLSGSVRERGIAAVAALLYGGGLGWEAVLTALQDAAFGRSAVEAALPQFSMATPPPLSVSNEQLAQFYIRLAELYPTSSEDQDGAPAAHQDPVEVSRRVDDWKSSCVRELAARGTWAAVETLRSIQQRLADPDAIAYVVREAIANARLMSWVPVTLPEFRQLLRDRAGRRVQNGDDLLQLVHDSLLRLQEKLQSGQRAVVDLWNEVPDTLVDELLTAVGAQHEATVEESVTPVVPTGMGSPHAGGKPPNVVRAQPSKRKRAETRFLPKDENRLSDYVQRHLKADLDAHLVSINREVQISRGRFLDLLVEVFVLGPDGSTQQRIAAAVETKGCWHPAVKTAMRTQLVDSYLTESGTQHGIYLVGWFLCPAWRVSGDPRYQKTPKSFTLAEFQRLLDNQAEELSGDGRRVRAIVLDVALRPEETGGDPAEKPATASRNINTGNGIRKPGARKRGAK